MGRIEEGVYREEVDAMLGVGDTQRKTKLESFWWAESIDDGTVRLELLDMDDNRTGIVEEMPRDEFQQRYVYQPDHLATKEERKKQRGADRIVALAEKHYEDEEYLSAEYEFGRAIKLDEENVRANFGLGKTFLAMGEDDKAKQVFKKLSTIEAVFEEQHKHLFNEFGIKMRELGLFDEAVQYYSKSIGLVEKDDENLYFNLGRALKEKGDVPEAIKKLKRAIEINPDFEEGKRFLSRLEAESGDG